MGAPAEIEIEIINLVHGAAPVVDVDEPSVVMPVAARDATPPVRRRTAPHSTTMIAAGPRATAGHSGTCPIPATPDRAATPILDYSQ